MKLIDYGAEVDFSGTLTLPVASSSNPVCDVERVATFTGTPPTSQIDKVMTLGET